MTQAQRQQREIDLSTVFEALERPLALIDSPERRADMHAGPVQSSIRW